MSKFSSSLRLLAVAGLLLATSAAFAQPSVGGPPAPTPAPDPDPAAVPLDGGASLLVAAGIGFGIRKMRTRFRRA